MRRFLLALGFLASGGSGARRNASWTAKDERS